MNETELVALCRKGHEAGFTGLYNKYARTTYNSICRIVSHTAEAEDILQESFYHAFKDIHRLQQVHSFGAWVKRIALNRSITHLRKRSISFSDADLVGIPDEAHYDEEEDRLMDRKVEEIRQAIDRLPTGYKTILSLYVFEEMRHEEIASLLGISHSTARTQYHRAKKKVIQSLEKKTLL